MNFSVPHANIQLVAYERVYLDVNEEATVKFSITPEQMSVYYDPDDVFIVFPSKKLLIYFFGLFFIL